MNYSEIMDKLIGAFPKGEIRVPTDTIAHIFGREYKENFISDWLAYLFSPDKMGTAECINSLISLANETASFDEESDIVIIREYSFEDRSRIDFLIESEDIVLGIENKILSDLGSKQLNDYSDELVKYNKKNKRIIKILLYPQKNKANNVIKALNNPSELHGFVPVTYEDLVDAYKSIRIDFIKNLRASFMLQDFITNMEECIMANDSDIGTIDFEMLSFANGYKDELQKLGEGINNSKKQFKQFVDKRLNDEFDQIEWSYASPSTCNYFQLFKNDTAAGWGRLVHYELLNRDGIFPPAKLQVVLHTRECGKTGKTDKLYELQKEVTEYIKKEYGTDEFDINYKSKDAFLISMDKIFKVLNDIKTKYTQIVDEELLKASMPK